MSARHAADGTGGDDGRGTWSAFATLPDAARAAALGDALEGIASAGVGVFEMEDGSGLHEVAAWFAGPPDPAALALCEAAFAVVFRVSEIPETDWVAKVRRDLAPVEAGRFFLYGAHDAGRVPAGRVALLIEAAMAFGTGHHGTTAGCLRALDRLAEAGFAPRRVADIGCGTAVLAMAAAKVWPQAAVIASDIDPVAVDVATVNIAANGLAFPCVVAAGFDHPDLAAEAFDLVLANILKGPLLDLAPEIARRTAPGGRVILSGLLADQAEDVRRACEAEGLSQEAAGILGDWATLVLVR